MINKLQADSAARIQVAPGHTQDSQLLHVKMSLIKIM